MDSEQSPVELALDQAPTEPDSVATTEEVIAEQQPEESQEDDSEEIEHNGATYKVPKELKDAFLMQQDYTKKTQEVAEDRKTLEAQQQTYQQRVQFQQAHLQDVANLSALDQQIALYKDVDWNALIDNDPVEAMKLDRQYKSLTDAYQQTSYRLQQAEQQTSLNLQQNIVRQVEQSRDVLTRELKDWTPAVGKEVSSYIKSYERMGINDAVMRDINNGMYGPTPIIWARKAQLYDQMISKATGKSETEPPPKPVTKVGSKASATKEPLQMSDREFANWRHRQISQRGSR